MKSWNQHLTAKVASSFLVLSLVAVGVVGSVAFFSAREALKQAAFNRLSVAATLKEEEIGRWFEDQQRDFLLVTQHPELQRNIKILLSGKTADPSYLAANKILSNYLISVSQTKPALREIFILDRSNQIVLSTDKQREGDYEILANVTYFERVEATATFDPIFYVSPVTGKPSVTLATPLRDASGVRQGIILAHLNLDRIDRIVRERTGLGNSGETYLVGSLVTKNAFISKADKTEAQEFPEGISSQGIDAAMSGVSGSGLYRNYAKLPVIGVYRWLNEQDLALLVEMQQEEAFAPARQLAGTIVLVGLASVGCLSIGVYWLTRQLKISREQLENYSHKLEQKAQEAEAANLAKSEFLANMSHELRTPLNAILGFTQLMSRDRSLNAAQLENLDTINRSGEHLLTLINDVLSMAKIEAGRTILNENSFDLYELLDSLEEMLQLKAEAKGLQLIFERTPEVPQCVRADESKLRQVLINLLGNAIKFTQAGGAILRVRTKQDKQEVSQLQPNNCILHFEVEDTGPGIAPSELERLFKPFVQTEAGRKSHEGTGLGLTISQQFVRLMGGEIAVSTTLGHGTIFSFEIPVSPTAVVEVPPRQHYRRVIGLAPDQPKYRILVVEDKWENRQLLVKMLESVGFEVREAENGEEGVAIWETWQPQLIWMDMRMPVMDGYEATRQIKAHLKGHATIIIALTASAFDEERAVVLSAGCNDFVRKPLREEVIWEKMMQYLGVRYIYEDTQQAAIPSQQEEKEPYTLTAQSLRVMPPEWVVELHQAALRTDEKLIFDLLEQIPQDYTPMATALADLVNNFRIDKIIDLTQLDSA
ncbi:hybrid sensor histidine kinase/response regulator [Scytonema millei]|uniref:Circadian input-output histidine kinase CikA n=1 Tax=Scytonema millei VB511283 TaxID=1245923 RepID=A0A9X5E748_9CYAN|nr:ATP-binding protein [Scytonema millei]NHC36158.1 response regulator [Scytonema millei VB511283]